MILKGLPYHDITDTDGKLAVRCLKFRNKFNRPTKMGVYSAGFRLVCDDGKLRFFTNGHLRFLMSHPDVHALSITPRSSRISFNDDGSVRDYYGKPLRSRRYDVFKNFDDVFSTVMVMKAANDGNIVPAMAFINESRDKVCLYASRRMRTTEGKVKQYLASAEEKFLNELKIANVTIIQPLLAWFVKCLCMVMLKNRSFSHPFIPGFYDRDLRFSEYQPEL